LIFGGAERCLSRPEATKFRILANVPLPFYRRGNEIRTFDEAIVAFFQPRQRDLIF